MAWRVAAALDQLLKQWNALFSKRSKLSDGSIGDAAHASRSSDHNPWYGPGIVTARDFTHDPANGADCQKLADALVASKDPRIKYIIWNRRIWENGWTAYNGTNPHTKHLHLSVKANASADSTAVWNLPGLSGSAPTPKPPTEAELSAQFEVDQRARWAKEDLLESDLRADLAVKQKQIDELVTKVNAIVLALAATKVA